MIRFALFVDGSNLFGSLKSMNLQVQDYEELYAYVFKEAHAVWKDASHLIGNQEAELRRVYWYTIGSMDDWNLTLPQSQTALRNAFNQDRETRAFWLETAGRAHPGTTGQALEDRAWAMCFNDFSDWYEQKKLTLSGMRDFHQSVRLRTDFIDIHEDGHWKVNFLRKAVDEKGVDTSLAVDMVALEENYDVGVVVSGDADIIPSIRHLKTRNKYIAAVEFVSGSPPETKGRNFSSRLKEHADFVVRVYETELLRLRIASRPPTASVTSVAPIPP